MEEDLYELRECLDQLKGEVLIVSIVEFDMLKTNYERLLLLAHSWPKIIGIHFHQAIMIFLPLRLNL